MASRKTKATDEELFKALDGLEQDSKPAKTAKKATTTSKATKASKIDQLKKSEQELLAELDSLAQERPSTPRLSTPSISGPRSPKKQSTSSPSVSTRTSEDKPAPSRKSGESTRSYHKSIKPLEDEKPQELNEEPERPAKEAGHEKPAVTGGGGWWGNVFSTATAAATAAIKSAEAAAKELQQNEEAKKWTEQVKGNVSTLRGFGGELRSRAMPTFTNILNTLAPPISSHERLQIHITHDMVGYPSLDPLIYQTFSRVMAQVEGGDLMVIQRGHESTQRRGSDVGGFTGSSGSGWSDGPWWRQTEGRRDLGSVKGLIEGTKLVKVSAESYSLEYYSSKGGLDEATKQATEVLSEHNPVRRSDIFLAIQAISHTAPEELFGGRPSPEQKSPDVTEPEEKPDELICFAIYLHDPVHGITFHTLSQTIPEKWLTWLDAPASTHLTSSDAPSSPSEERPGFFSRRTQKEAYLPEEIAEIVSSGGVDPREWVAEWVEETLALGVGIVAQRYVARRMGVGEGGIGRGKARQEVISDGGGEAARAI